ncbi:MAG: IclR family transcriptional regulator [Pseudomonadota bacterium]
MSDTAGERIPTNLRTMLILEAVGTQSEPMTAAEVGRLIGLPKQTVHRLCNTLVEEGFLVRTAKNGGLLPGRRARMMAAGTLFASSSHIARRQILQKLADEIGETVNFVVPEDKGMSYKDRVETGWPFRIQLPIGSHVPFHCTASGKTFLSSRRKAERKHLVETMDLKASTANTLSQPDDLLRELNMIARRGYALDNEEFIDGMIAIAVPVRDSQGRYLASIGVHGPTQRFSLEKADSFAPTLHEASTQLAGVLCNA